LTIGEHATPRALAMWGSGERTKAVHYARLHGMGRYKATRWDG
jgi:hypothetical protein